MVEKSRKAGVKPTPTVYTALIRVLLRCGRPENAADVRHVGVGTVSTNLCGFVIW